MPNNAVSGKFEAVYDIIPITVVILLRILGIDPGVATVGFGVIEADGPNMKMVRCGVITTAAGLPLSVRLRQIQR